MLTRSLSRALLVLGGLAAIGYPALDIATGRGPQWHWLNNLEAWLAFYLVGAFAFVRRPDHPVARRLLLAGACIVLVTTLGQLVSVVYVKAGLQSWMWAAISLQGVAATATLAALVATFAVFPDGQYQRPYERWVVRAVAVLPFLISGLLLLTFSALPVNGYFVWAAPSVTSPLYVSALAPLGPLVGVLATAQLTLIVLAAALLLLRYRRFDEDRRLQVRWPLFSLLFVIPLGMGPLGFLFGVAGSLPAGAGSNAVAGVVLPTLPAALAIGLLRPHLLDLELVIRKSLAFAVLWVLIAVGYVAIAAAVGVAAGQRSALGAAVLVTVLATLAFQPARAALERLAARLVYGERLTGYQAVSRLGVKLEGAADVRQTGELVAATVRQALDASWARVVIDGTDPTVVANGAGAASAAEAVLTAPLVYGDEVVGRVECGPRGEGRYRARDQELLLTLSRHAALAIRNAALAVELAEHLERINIQAQQLRASRERIVQAEEAGRRRLERDIHDGVQQELVALLAKIRLARNQVGHDPAALASLLEELQEETKLALHDLRDLAQGIHPTVLTDRGLVEAVEDRASRMPASVTIEAEPALRGARFPQEIEGAAYFMVCEGLANALKHAAAGQLDVRLSSDPRGLRIEVTDDGAGFDAAKVSRSGLSGLEDRIEALGGQLLVSSTPGQGTRLEARLPARAASRA